MLLAGIEVQDHDLLTLARLLRDAGFDSTALHIERAFDAVAREVPLSIEERNVILRVLDGANTEGLARIRSVLIQENAARVA